VICLSVYGDHAHSKGSGFDHFNDLRAEPTPSVRLGDGEGR
jgi:hypothetical protein